MGVHSRWGEQKGKGEGKRKGRERKEREEKRERKRRNGERKREKRKSACSFSDRRRSNGQNSSNEEVKFVYSTRSMLQEVGILPTVVYFHLKGLFVKYGNAVCFDPDTGRIFVPVLG